MAEGKKSFVLYCDLIHTVKKLPAEKQGELFMTILEYVNDLEPVVEDLSVDLVFEPIKLQLKRDLVKYESICDRNKINGKKGGRPRKTQKTQSVNLATQNNPKKPKKADTDNVTETDSDNVNEITKKGLIINPSKKEVFNRWLEYRKEMKKPIKITKTKEALINKFNDQPLEVCERTVDLSIENGYQGLIWNNKPQSKVNGKASMNSPII